MARKKMLADLDKDFEESSNFVDSVLGATESTEEDVSNIFQEVATPTRKIMSQEEIEMNPSNPKWTEYVLSKLEDNEMCKGNPRVAGLRRAIELLIGEIIETDTKFYEFPTEDNQKRCSATHRVVVRTLNGTVKAFSGSADTSPRNMDVNFLKFPVAVCETRAKARAYRDLLGLQCVAAEELVENPAEEMDVFLDNSISDAQLTGIDNMCKRNNINPKVLFRNYLDSQGVDRITHLTKKHAHMILDELNSYQTNKKKPSPNLVGYVSNWRGNKEN